MRKSKTTFLGAAAAALLAMMQTACVLNNPHGYRSDQSHSEAMNVLMAAAILRDPMRSAVRDTAARDRPWFKPDAGKAESFSMFIAFKPVEGEEETAQDAKERIKEAVQHAYVPIAAPGYEIKSEREGYSRGILGSRMRYWYVGPNCAMGECEFKMALSPNPPDKIAAPDFLGGQGEVWLSRIGITRPKTEPGADETEVQAVSGALPSWVYFYVAPTAGVWSYPVMYHMGEPMYFRVPYKKNHGWHYAPGENVY